MDATIKNYISNTLHKLAIIEEADIAYENVELYQFQKAYENGVPFKKQNGERYAIALLNAITLESASKIARELKKNKNLSLKGLTQLVDSHRLKCYIEGTSPSYNTWKSGDIGVVFITYSDEKREIIPNFINESI
ncbi:hypothetical protein [Wenyingzhuangia sp. IMCC45574]